MRELTSEEIKKYDFAMLKFVKKFCDELFKYSKMYDEVLTHLYGNTYMQLPKEEDRYNHNIKAWTKE